MKPVKVDVIYPLPEGWGICLSCEMLMARANLDKAPHERGLDEYPEEWRDEFERLSTMVLNLSASYPDNLQVRLWDPRSFQGLLKAIRYWVRRYPTFILNDQAKMVGWDYNQLEQMVRTASS